MRPAAYLIVERCGLLAAMLKCRLAQNLRIVAANLCA